MASVHSIADKQEIAFLLYLKSIIVFFLKSCLFLILGLLIPDTLRSFCHCVFWTNMLPAHRGSAGCYYWMHCLVLNTFIFLLLISSMCNSFCSPLRFYLLQILPFKFHYKASTTFAVAFNWKSEIKLSLPLNLKEISLLFQLSISWLASLLISLIPFQLSNNFWKGAISSALLKFRR